MPAATIQSCYPHNGIKPVAIALCVARRFGVWLRSSGGARRLSAPRTTYLSPVTGSGSGGVSGYGRGCTRKLCLTALPMAQTAPRSLKMITGVIARLGTYGHQIGGEGTAGPDDAAARSGPLNRRIAGFAY